MRQIFGIFLPTMIAETIFDENNTTDTNIEHDNAVTVVGDGTDNVEYETNTHHHHILVWQ